MDIRWQALLLVAVVVGSIFLSDSLIFQADSKTTASVSSFEVATGTFGQGTALFGKDEIVVKKAPVRDWGVLDPQISAKAILIQSLDDQFPFYHYNTYALWPTASLTKVLTALVVLENTPLSKKAEVTERAILTEGVAGGLRSGEIYSVEDLLKIMLLTSSNDAATAFEDLMGGQDNFVRLLNKRAGELGMTQSLFYDAAGFSDLNQTTANDLLRLMRYVTQNRPEILNWTRSPSFLVQPINHFESRIVGNINPLVNNSRFLGGKTGTSFEARENLAAIFSFQDQRIVVIVLGSSNRTKEMETLLSWIKEAYNL